MNNLKLQQDLVQQKLSLYNQQILCYRKVLERLQQERDKLLFEEEIIQEKLKIAQIKDTSSLQFELEQLTNTISNSAELISSVPSFEPPYSETVEEEKDRIIMNLVEAEETLPSSTKWQDINLLENSLLKNRFKGEECCVSSSLSNRHVEDRDKRELKISKEFLELFLNNPQSIFSYEYLLRYFNIPSQDLDRSIQQHLGRTICENIYNSNHYQLLEENNLEANSNLNKLPYSKLFTEENLSLSLNKIILKMKGEFSVQTVLDKIYSKSEINSWSKEQKAKYTHYISNRLCIGKNKKQWERVGVGTYQNFKS